jgi:hypothetical protein
LAIAGQLSSASTTPSRSPSVVGEPSIPASASGGAPPARHTGGSVLVSQRWPLGHARVSLHGRPSSIAGA